MVCFLELGQDVHVTGGGLYDAINEGVRQGYKEGYLRASIVRSPFDRVNTGDNTPAVIHLDVVPGADAQDPDHGQGRRLREPLEVQDAHAGRGGGRREGLHHRVREDRGPRRLPAADPGRGRRRHLREGRAPRKKALFRELGAPNPDPAVGRVEQELLERANRLGIGPQGYGGDTTSFGIHILTYPCHITSCR